MIHFTPILPQSPSKLTRLPEQGAKHMSITDMCFSTKSSQSQKLNDLFRAFNSPLRAVLTESPFSLQGHPSRRVVVVP
jgi:hypothetical protein